jgi:hypothetical protein
MILPIFEVSTKYLRHVGHGVARISICLKINAYLFEGSVSPASWGSGQGFGDRLDLLQVQAGTNLNLNLTRDLNS